MERPQIEVLNLTRKGKLRFEIEGKKTSHYSRPEEECRSVNKTTREQSDFRKLNNIEVVLYTAKLLCASEDVVFLSGELGNSDISKNSLTHNTT